MMTLEQLQSIARDFMDNAPENRVPEDKAMAPDVVGMRLCETALLGAAPADDEMLMSLCQPSEAGLIMKPPAFWVDSAQSIISVFAPFSEQVRVSNRAERDRPSAAWKHARIEGQQCIFALCRHLKAVIEDEGFHAVIPSIDERFWTDSWKSMQDGKRTTYQSNWSERHVAYVCGLGTFSRSKGLITARGIAGRFGSLVTDMAIAPTPRPYTSREEYCTRCGACARNCPVQAISMTEPKDDLRCAALVNEVYRENAPYYGCGKCQVGVPCEAGIPGRHVKADNLA